MDRIELSTYNSEGLYGETEDDFVSTVTCELNKLFAEDRDSAITHVRVIIEVKH